MGWGIKCDHGFSGLMIFEGDWSKKTSGFSWLGMAGINKKDGGGDSVMKCLRGDGNWVTECYPTTHLIFVGHILTALASLAWIL